MINGLSGVTVLRGGILVILLDSCVLEFFFFKLYALLTREINNLEHARACQKFHVCELVKNTRLAQSQLVVLPRTVKATKVYFIAYTVPGSHAAKILSKLVSCSNSNK